MKGPGQLSRVGIVGGGERDGERVIANDIDFILFCLISSLQDSFFSILLGFLETICRTFIPLKF